MGDSSKQRRLHSKSRTGCTECKRRHIKCDEQRPVCVNCTVSRRTCGYSQPVPHNLEQRTRLSTLSPISGGVIDEERAADRHFSVEHMSLFNHVILYMDDWLAVTESMRPFSQLYIRTALKSSSVMHQLLAIAALHLAEQNPTSSNSYRQMAAELQNQGLALFDGEQAALELWVFSSLVSVHILAQTFMSCRGRGIDVFIDSLTSHIAIYQGARIIGQTSWGDIQNSELKSWFARIEEEQEIDKLYLSRNQESIMAMLQSSQLDKATINTCSAASQTLDFVRRRLHSPRSWGAHAPMAWVNLLSEDYVQLLRKRTPEALVIFAHYAELIHQCRDFWVFGDAGKVLIRSIVTTLGPAWSQWLALPVEAVEKGKDQ